MFVCFFVDCNTSQMSYSLSSTPIQSQKSLLSRTSSIVTMKSTFSAVSHSVVHHVGPPLFIITYYNIEINNVRCQRAHSVNANGTEATRNMGEVVSLKLSSGCCTQD